MLRVNEEWEEFKNQCYWIANKHQGKKLRCGNSDNKTIIDYTKTAKYNQECCPRLAPVDVCEWQLTAVKDIAFYRTACDGLFEKLLHTEGMRFCPFCGKLIKGGGR